MATTGKSWDSNGAPTLEPQTPIFYPPSATPVLRPVRLTLAQQGILSNTSPKLVTDPWPVNVSQDTTLPSCHYARPCGKYVGCYFEPAGFKPPPPNVSLYAPLDPMWTPTLPFPHQSSLPFSQASTPPLLFSLPASRTPILPSSFSHSLPSSYKPAPTPEKDPQVPRYHCQHVLSTKRDPVYPTNKQGEQYGGPPAKVRKREQNSKFTKCRTAPPAIVHYTETPSSGKASNHPLSLETPSHPTQKSCSTILTSAENQDFLKQILPQSQAKTPASAGKLRVSKKAVKKVKEENPAITAELRFSCFSLCIELRVYEVDIVFACLFFFLLSCFWEMDKRDLGL